MGTEKKQLLQEGKLLMIRKKKTFMNGPNVFFISDCYKRPSRKKIIRDFGGKEKKNKARLI